MLYKLIYIVISACFLFACTKQVASPKGDQGQAGGTGNLIISQLNIVTKDSLDWKVNSGVWESSIFIPELDNDNIFNTCEVKVYMDINSSWWALPYIKDDYFIKYGIAKGYIKLSAYKFHGAPGHRPAKENFKVVLLYPVQ